jgi:hypothetical protein
MEHKPAKTPTTIVVGHTNNGFQLSSPDRFSKLVMAMVFSVRLAVLKQDPGMSWPPQKDYSIFTPTPPKRTSLLTLNDGSGCRLFNRLWIAVWNHVRREPHGVPTHPRRIDLTRPTKARERNNKSE